MLNSILDIIQKNLKSSEVCDCEKPNSLQKLPIHKKVCDFGSMTKIKKDLEELLNENSYWTFYAYDGIELLEKKEFNSYFDLKLYAGCHKAENNHKYVDYHSKYDRYHWGNL